MLGRSSRMMTGTGKRVLAHPTTLTSSQDSPPPSHPLKLPSKNHAKTASYPKPQSSSTPTTQLAPFTLLHLFLPESYQTGLGLGQISCWLITIQILSSSPSGVLVNSYQNDPKSQGIADGYSGVQYKESSRNFGHQQFVTIVVII